MGVNKPTIRHESRIPMHPYNRGGVANRYGRERVSEKPVGLEPSVSMVSGDSHEPNANFEFFHDYRVYKWPT